MNREIGDYIEDIVEAMNAATEFIDDMTYQDFVRDTKTIYCSN